MARWRRWAPVTLVLAALAVIGLRLLRPPMELSSRWATLEALRASGDATSRWVPLEVPPGAERIAEWHDLDLDVSVGFFSAAAPRPVAKASRPASMDQALRLGRRVLQDSRAEDLARAPTLWLACARDGELWNLTAIEPTTGSGVF